MARRPFRARYRLFLRRARRFLVHNVLHVDDPPHRLALGAAIAMFITFTPTIGLQMLLTVFFAWLLGGNKVIGIPIVWISNPVTFVPIYYPLYLLGVWLTGAQSVGLDWFQELANPANLPSGWWPTVEYFWAKLVHVAKPLWVGCLVFAAIIAVPTYFVVYSMVRAYRLRRFGQLTPPVRAAEP
ncbi:MAG: DUF2062 domain-containing protein [Phycisphaerae bacterium]|nr:DUF2062 domain-containing protein [Phycisphaerae bacterium]